MRRGSSAAETATRGTSGPRWLSENPDRAWAEKFFLIYTPIWILQTAVGVTLGFSTKLGDAGMLVHTGLVVLPFILVPLLLRRGAESGLRWHQTFWFKAVVYISILSLFGNYFGTEYFFDVLGMEYSYPKLRLYFDSALLGSGAQAVPLIMYPLTVAYYLTYHTTAAIVLRRVKTSRIRLVALAFPLAVVLVSFGWAWLETFAMANPMMADVFRYQDKSRMLAYGSLVYSTHFLASFPIFLHLDEKPGSRWTLLQTIAAAMASSLLTLFLLDLIARAIGHI